MTLTQVGVLQAVRANRETIIEISEVLRRSETLVGLAITILARKGLVEKLPDLSDFRKLIVRLTPMGRDLLTFTEEP